MPTLDEIDRIMTYCEEQKMFSNCLYHQPSGRIKPRANRPSPVLWLVKDGKPINYVDSEKRE